MPFQSPIRALMLLYAARRARSSLPARSQQIFERLTLLGTVIVAIEFDVSIDVINEMTQAIIVVPSAVGPRRAASGTFLG